MAEYNFSNFTADDLLEAELAEEERVARAQARADKSAGTLNAFKALMGQSQTARANVISSDSDAASLKAYSTGKDVEHLSHIRQRMATAMEEEKLGLNDIKKFNKWYGEQNFPYRFEKDIRTSYKSMSAQRASEVTATQTKKTFDQAQTDRTTAEAYDVKGEEANALLNRIKGQYTSGAKPGVPAISSDKAMDVLTSGLIELGIKGEDLASYTTRLKSQIDLTEKMRTGEVNKTAGQYAREVIRGLDKEDYTYVEALDRFNELTKNLDPASAGVTAARKILDDTIDAMKYTEETLSVVLRTGPNAGMMDFVTRKQLEEDLAKEPEHRLYASPQGKSELPPGMSIVAWMVVDKEGNQIIPDHFIKKMAIEGYSRLWALTDEERPWWNAWVKKYKATNPTLLEQLVQFTLGAQGAGGSSTGVGTVIVRPKD